MQQEDKKPNCTSTTGARKSFYDRPQKDPRGPRSYDKRDDRGEQKSRFYKKDHGEKASRESDRGEKSPRSFGSRNSSRASRNFSGERKSPREYIPQEEFTTPYVQPEPTGFTPFNLKRQLQKAIDKLGYTTPTQIQKEVWTAAISGKNIVGQSQTGTGKTTAFLLPLLQQIDNKNRYPQVLIVAPTRELVMQIREDIMKLTTYLQMRSMILIGGKSMQFQKDDLKYGPQFIVATPGRLIEFMQNRYFDVSKINYFVLDEVDRMLDMGFIEDVDRIWTQLDNLKQTMTFSATLAQEIKDVIKKHCHDYIDIRVGEKVTVDKIDHTYIEVPHEHKFATLVDILKSHEGQKTLVFSQTKRNTEALTKYLQQEKINGKNINVQFLNGDLDMRHRTRTLRAFKEGTCNILITTDVAARGLNMDNVQLVINFDVPREPESYVHRIGRTGRAGAEGKALMMVDKDERHLVMGIEKEHKIKLQKSSVIKPILDKADEYFDVNLDRPLPPSEKKRRMVARSISASYRQEHGGYNRDRYRGNRSSDRSRNNERHDSSRNYRSSRTSSYQDSNSYRKGDERKSFPRNTNRTTDERRTHSSNTNTFERKSFVENDITSRDTRSSRDSQSFRTSRPSRDTRTFKKIDTSERSFPKKDFTPRSSARSQFDNKPERYNRKVERSTYKLSTKSQSIGGYDVGFFNAQRRQEQEKFMKKPGGKSTKR